MPKEMQVRWVKRFVLGDPYYEHTRSNIHTDIVEHGGAIVGYESIEKNELQQYIDGEWRDVEIKNL